MKIDKVIVGILIIFSILPYASAVEINGCSNLNQENTIYYLNQSIENSSNIYCINISANNIILDCRGYKIDGNGTSFSYGIYVSRAFQQNSNITIRNCVISDWYYGIFFNLSSNNTVINISFLFNRFSVFLRYSSYNTLTNLTITSNVSLSHGIFLYYSNHNVIHFNRIERNTYGIRLSSSSYNRIFNNFFNNTFNIILTGESYNFWNTTRQLGTRIYTPGNYIGGNYWSNSSGNGCSDICNDSNRDGFCDNPCDITDEDRDYLPLKHLGILEIYATPPPLEIVKDKSFLINVSIKCKEKDCGNVSVGLRYNSSSSFPNFPIQLRPQTPFYIMPIRAMPSNYSITSYWGDPNYAFDGDNSTGFELGISRGEHANFTFPIHSTNASLFLRVGGEYGLAEEPGLGKYRVGYVRIFNFSSNSWYTFTGVNDSVMEKVLIFNLSSGLLSSNGTFFINFNISEDFSVMHIYEILILYHPTVCYSLKLEESCNLTFNVNATGNYYSTYLIDTNASSPATYSNDTQDFLITIIPGIMQVSLTFPSPLIIHNITRHTNFTIRGNVSCLEGECGNVTGILKYNKTSEFPDTPISSSVDTPFYIISNSSYCSFLRGGDSCSMMWVINATGEKYTEWKIGISVTSDLIRGEFTTQNLSIRILPICSQLPSIKEGKLRLTVECEEVSYSFAKIKQEFSHIYTLKAEFKVYNVSKLKNFMIGFGNGSLDIYGRPLNSFVFEFNDTHIRFLKYNLSLVEELGSISYSLPFRKNLSIEMNSSYVVFILEDERYEFAVFPSSTSWYFFANAYNSKDTIVDIDDIVIRKNILPGPQIYFGGEEFLRIKRLGLASEKGKNNFVSLEKILRLDQICTQEGYQALKTEFGLEAEFYLLIRRINDNNVLLRCGIPLKGEPFAYIERTVALDDGSYAKLELRIWK